MGDRATISQVLTAMLTGVQHLLAAKMVQRMGVRG